MKNSFYTVIAAFCLCLCGTLKSQQQLPARHAVGISFGAGVSADGYGMRYAPGIYYRCGRNTFTLDVLLQRELHNYSGTSLRWDYGLNKYDSSCDFQIFTFVQPIYNKHAYLGRQAMLQEKLAEVPGAIDPAKYQFESVELYGGFGLKWRFLNRFEWVNMIGIGGYYTLNYPGHLYYTPSCFGITFRTGIRMRVNP